MIRTNTDDESMRESLEEVVELFELAQAAVFKLMASVSNFETVVACSRLMLACRIRSLSSFEILKTPPYFGIMRSISHQALTAPCLLLPIER